MAIFIRPVAFPLAMPVNLQVLLFHYLASAGRTRRKSTNAIKDDHIIQISIAHISLMKKSSLHRNLYSRSRLLSTDVGMFVKCMACGHAFRSRFQEDRIETYQEFDLSYR